MNQVFHVPGALSGGTRTRITVVGLGGTGSHFAEALARLQQTLQALGHPGFDVTLVDGDHVSRWNVGRQRFYVPDIGGNKALALQHRINLAFGFNWEAVPSMFDPATLNPACYQRNRTDILVTCTDKAAFRVAVGKAVPRAAQSELLWLDFGNGSTEAQCVMGHLGTPKAGLRLPNVYDLHPELSTMDAVDRDEPSCSMEEAIMRQEFPVNPMVAQLGVALLWSLVRKGKVDHHGYHLETDPAVVTRPLPIDPDTWAFFGYVPTKRRVPKNQAIRN